MNVVFKPYVTPVMQRYLEFLRWHHNYSLERLLDTFPEYLEKVEEKVKDTSRKRLF